VTGTRAYLTGWNGIAVLNVANPAAPVLLGAYGPQVAPSIALAGDYAYCPGTDTLYVLDITDPSDPVIAGQIRLSPPDGTRRATASGDHVYLYGYNAGMQIINVTNPAAPSQDGQYACRFTDIAVRDSLVYGVGGDTLKIINVTDPATPAEIGRYHWGDEWLFIGITVRDDYAYVVAMNEPESVRGLLVVGISDPTAPDSIGAFFEIGSSNYNGDIEIRDTCAYIWGCPTVIDISDPSAPAGMPGSPMPPYLPDGGARLAHRGV
jgi:hypothetical protein